MRRHAADLLRFVAGGVLLAILIPLDYFVAIPEWEVLLGRSRVARDLAVSGCVTWVAAIALAMWLGGFTAIEPVPFRVFGNP